MARGRDEGGYVLALGFGTSVTMWAVGYAARVPPVFVPGTTLLGMLLACQCAGGWLAGRHTGAGVRAGAWVGGVSALLNLLVLGSLLAEGESGRILTRGLVWVPGSILLGVVLGVLGSAIASRAPARVEQAAPMERGNWTAVFAAVAATATFLLLVVGGLVTSEGAGLAVVDWPNSFGRGMFLYPLSRMTGGIYYEHAHRLFGSLVGLTTLTLAAFLARTDSRGWVKRLALAALAAVVLQGVLGGLRVTGRFTWSTNPADTAPSLLLAVVHGVFGQLVFGILVALAVVTTPGWRNWRGAAAELGRELDRRLSTALVAVVVVQLVLGAILRHFSAALVVHVLVATVVLALGITTGVRAGAEPTRAPGIRRLGDGVTWGLFAQLVLGLGALVATVFAGGRMPPPRYEVIVTTAHQAMGALVLALAVALMAWTRRADGRLT